MTARGVIRDWSKGLLSDNAAADKAEVESRKKDIINLSIQHSIVTEHTSFVAVEERTVRRWCKRGVMRAG